MTTSISAERRISLISVPVIPQPTLSGVPKVIHQVIMNFLTMKNIVQSVRLVKKDWSLFTRNECSSLDLSSTIIELFVLFSIRDYSKHLHKLQSVCLNYCREFSGDDACQALQFLPSLTKLRLPSGTTDQGLKHFANYQSHLEHLSLQGCRNVTDIGLEKFAKTNFHLKYLNLQKCEITAQGLVHLAKFSLTYLDISYCKQIENSALNVVSKHPLTTLKLKNCHRITDVGMEYLSHLRLKRLWLSGCFSILKKGFAHLSKMPLQWLRLDYTEISDASLFYQLHLPFLTDLDIGYCDNIRDLQCLSPFSLKTLGISGFKAFDDDNAEVLSKLGITSLNISSTNINYKQFSMLFRLPLRYLNMRDNFYIQHDVRNTLLQFSNLTTLELTPTVDTKKRQTIAALIDYYFDMHPPFNKVLPFPRLVGETYDVFGTILDYLEPQSCS